MVQEKYTGPYTYLGLYEQYNIAQAEFEELVDYSAPEDVLSKNKHKEYWIKPSSVKTIAKGSELSELFSKFNSVPFDDRVNREAKVKDIRRGHLEDFLRDGNSSLVDEINNKPIEEVLVNAVFHKSYRVQEPVEIRVYVDCIKIINHPGPEKSIDMDELRTGNAISRRYRNRRIGEFLKEIDLAERKSTGITKILRALERNGSPPPEFKTNDERDYLIVTIHEHKAFESSSNGNGIEFPIGRQSVAIGRDDR